MLFHRQGLLWLVSVAVRYTSYLFSLPTVLVKPRKRWLRSDMTEKLLTGSLSLNTIQGTIGLENAHLKPDLGILSHHQMTLTLNTHTAN